MTNKVNNNDNFEQELQAYIEHMNEELSAAEALIQAMKNAEAQKGGIQQNLDSLNKYMSMFYLNEMILHPGWIAWITKTSFEKIYCSSFYKRAQNDKDQIAALENTITQKESALKAIDPNINLTLINQLNQMLSQEDSLSNDHLRGADLSRALQQATVIFSQLCDVLMDTIRADLAQAGMVKFGSDPNHAAAILQFAGIAIQAEFQEQLSLQSVQTNVISDETDWQKEKSNAEADLKTAHWYDFFTGGGPNSGKDHAEIRAANAMISILNEIERAISPLISTIDPGMQEFSIELDQLKAKFQQFLSGHGTIQQIKDAMIAVLSILVGIIAETTKDAAMYDKEMNQGSMAFSEMKLNDSLSQEEVIEDAKKYAAIMGQLMAAAKYLGMALIFLLNPGIAMAVMVAIEATLTASGVMDKLQTALENKLGTIGGAIATCGIEMVGTAGGAAAIEAGVSQVAEQAAAAATTEAVEKTIEEVVQTVTEAAVKASGNGVKAAGQAVAEAAENGAAGQGIGAAEQAAAQSAQAAEKVTDKTVRLAVETAQKKVTAVYMNKTFSALMNSFIKGDLRVTMETAMKEAAENAGKEIQILADTAAKQGSAAVIGDTEIESIATTSANRAVANTTKTTEESVAKAGEKTALRKGLVRAGFTGMAAAGATGLPIDFAAATEKKDKKDLSEQYQIAMQVIQTLMQFIGMIGSSDIGVQSIMAPGPVSKLLFGASAAQSGMEAIGSAGEAAADFEQAGAVKALAQNQSILDMMQFVMSQLRKEGNLQRNQYAKEMQQSSKTNMRLSIHFNDANQAVAEAMSVLSV